jgi:hypothetical protein
MPPCYPLARRIQTSGDKGFGTKGDSGTACLYAVAAWPDREMAESACA